MRSFSLWQLAGFGITAVCGTGLHFLYDLCGESPLAGLFSGVNESTWEHMKLLYVPLVLYALAERLFFRGVAGFWQIKAAGIVTGVMLIPLLFYTWNGAFGKSPDWVNIGIYFVAAAAAFMLEARLYTAPSGALPRSWLAKGALLLLGVLFVVFTFAPPHLPLFRDPLTGGYGSFLPVGG
ncbi:MAG: hypothetical protein IKL89_09210 [Clostridia bacterium]|nr:hypothetical protein [Clostridia bacterium]